MRAVHQPTPLPLLRTELTLARLRRSVRGTVRSFAPRASLGPPGGPPQAVHVVLAGLVSLAWTADDGRQAILTVAGPGGVIGQETVIPIGASAPASSESAPSDPSASSDHLVEARALVPSTTLALPASELRGALHRDPLIAVWLAESLSRRMRTLERAMIRLLSLPVRERVLEVLSELALTHGERHPWGTVVQVPLCQDDIAALVCATRETVNRTLRRLEASGEVRRVDGAYALYSPILDQAPEPGIS